MIDWKKPIEMYDERPARLVGTYVCAGKQVTIVATFLSPPTEGVGSPGDETLHEVDDEGRCWSLHYPRKHLVRNAPAEHTKYMVVCGSGGPGSVISLQGSKSDARKLAGKYDDCTAIVKVTWKDGDGLLKW